MNRREEVLSKLSLVLDPELDQSLTELGFIDDIELSGNDVTVSFRLPTYWCGVNFSFLMAADIRKRVSELPWVNNVSVRLKDHSFAKDINEAVSNGKSFREAFPDMATEDLDELQRHFRMKAFTVRQEKLLRYLLQSGFSKSSIVRMTVQELRKLQEHDKNGRPFIERYLDILQELNFPMKPEGLAFLKSDRDPITEHEFDRYLLHSRRTRISMEFNANYCRGLFKTRYETG
jgi:metal-sulfur cluster biosynthetic enzyme